KNLSQKFFFEKPVRINFAGFSIFDISIKSYVKNFLKTVQSTDFLRVRICYLARHSASSIQINK
ncbi:hypothetical protein BpHYR1_050621, partial [Brachionus plicatilis]